MVFIFRRVAAERVSPGAPRDSASPWKILRRNQAALAATVLLGILSPLTRLDFFSLLPGVSLAMLASPLAAFFSPLRGSKTMQHWAPSPALFCRKKHKRHK
jgi:hypothetical protein